jgi:AraC family transcriptional regulator of adaptative response/methylated-DNA-[protein]-cysteine methyltransferase
MSNHTLQAGGLTVRYGFHSTPFGEAMLAVTARGICALAFVEEGGRESALASLGREWAGARVVEDADGTASIAAGVFSRGPQSDVPVDVDLRGTSFQRAVWETLRGVPRGSLTTYEDIARRIGRPRATRAVGSAISRNPVAFVVPCHRVIRKSGDLGGYRWGLVRKGRILSWEKQGA